jgi:hypothetical protein
MVDEQKTNINLHGFAMHLATENHLKSEFAQKYFKQANLKKIPFINYLAQEKYLPSEKLAKLASDYYKLPYFEINDFNPKFLSNDIITQLSFLNKEVNK